MGSDGKNALSYPLSTEHPQNLLLGQLFGTSESEQ